MSEQFDVFISYKREERDLADGLVRALNAAGYSTVTDQDITPSEHFGDAIDGMIRSARVVAVLWTPAAAASKWVRFEAEEAQEQGKYLGFMLEDVPPADLPPMVRRVQYVGLVDQTPDAYGAAIVETIEQRIEPSQGTSALAIEASHAAQEEFSVFNSIVVLNSVEGYEAFLKRYPASRFVLPVKARLKELKGPLEGLKRVMPVLTVFFALLSGVLGYLQLSPGEPPSALVEALQEELASTKGEREKFEALFEEADRRAVAVLSDLNAAKGEATDLRTQNRSLAAKLETVETHAVQVLAENEALAGKLAVTEAALADTLETSVPDSDCEVGGKDGIEIAGDCVALDETSLDLSGKDIIDLLPLAGLTALQRLYLNNTQVADLSPLAGLTSLQMLSIAITEVDDLSPLAGLSDLFLLYLPDGTLLREYPRSDEGHKEVQDFLAGL